MSKALSAYKQEMALQATEMRSTLAQMSTSTRLSIDDGQFKLPSGKLIGAKVKVVILGYVRNNALYTGAYDPTNRAAPICSAVGKLLDDSMAPKANSEDPQSTTCAVCEQNEWGSRGDGSNAKACKNTYTAAVVIPNDPENILHLNVSATALKSWDEAIQALLEAAPGSLACSYIAHLEIKRVNRAKIVTIATAEPNPNEEQSFGLTAKAMKELLR